MAAHDLGSCPVCGSTTAGAADLAGHLVDEAGRSDAGHVMWLNRHVTKHAVPASQLAGMLERWAVAGGSGQPTLRR